MTSITSQPCDNSQQSTSILVVAKISQQLLTQSAQYAESLLSQQASKLYAVFWTRMARRDVGKGYTHTAESTPSHYHIGYEHGAAHLPTFTVTDEVEATQAAYMRSLSQADETEYLRGFMHGFSSQPRQAVQV